MAFEQDKVMAFLPDLGDWWAFSPPDAKRSDFLSAVFNQLPFAALINGDVFSMHSDYRQTFPSLKKLTLKRKAKTFREKGFVQIWSGVIRSK
jgi:hypothetical protein